MNEYRNWNKSVWVLGDIHGDFEALMQLIKTKNKLKNCYLIVLGDCGFGFKRSYIGVLEELEDVCKDKHIMVGFIRGNHDDPQYWSDEEYRKKRTGLRHFSHLQFIEDNSIINIKGKHYYCVGGAISIDRSQRVENVSYWTDEAMNFVEDKYKELISKYNVERIWGILSHTGPKPFARQIDTNFFRTIRLVDTNFVNESLYEQTMVNFMYQLMKPVCWHYGHWHVKEKMVVYNSTFFAHNIFGLHQLT